MARTREFDLTLRLPAGSGLLRWHVALAEHLAAIGLSPRIEYVIDRNPPYWLGLLRMVEQALYASQSLGRLDMLAPAAPIMLPRQESRAGEKICIDCTSASGSDAVAPDGVRRILRPGTGDGLLIETLLAASLDGTPPHVGWRNGEGRTLIAGRSAILAPHIHSQSVSQALARIISMVDQALIAEPAQGSPPAARHAGVLGVAIGAGAAFSSRVMAAINQRLKAGKQWNVGWRQHQPGQSIMETGRIDPASFTWLPRDPARYFADPFPVDFGGRKMLFVEDFPYATGRAVLSAFDIGPEGPVGPPIPVLERPHHLSYPCIFEHGGSLWMLPESAGARRLELFRCERFPDRWSLHTVLFEGQIIADATFFQHGGLCWLAAGIADNGAADQDALGLWHATNPAGPWTPHEQNPVVVDVATARPGGWMTNVGGVLRRAAQDCTHGYGWGISLLDIEVLTPASYRQRLVATLPPPPSLGATAFHTVNVGAGIEAIDCVL